MKLWVHRLTIDGETKFITNADFRPMYDANGCKIPSQMKWTPFKVVLPDEYEPTEMDDGRVTLEDLTGQRVDLASVLDISKETGGPVLKFERSDDTLPPCFVDLAEADR